MISCVSSDRLHRVKRNDSFIRVVLFQTRTLQHFSHSDDKRVFIPVFFFATFISHLRLVSHVAEATGSIPLKCRYRLNCRCHNPFSFHLFYAAKIITISVPAAKPLCFNAFLQLFSTVSDAKLQLFSSISMPFFIAVH